MKNKTNSPDKRSTSAMKEHTHHSKSGGRPHSTAKPSGSGGFKSAHHRSEERPDFPRKTREQFSAVSASDKAAPDNRGKAATSRTQGHDAGKRPAFKDENTGEFRKQRKGAKPTLGARREDSETRGAFSSKRATARPTAQREGATEKAAPTAPRQHAKHAPAKAATAPRPAGKRGHSPFGDAPPRDRDQAPHPARKAAAGSKAPATAHRKGSPSKTSSAPSHEAAPLRAGQTLELAITSINDDGFGVAYHEGTRILVAHTIPGEQVVVRVTYVGRREAFGNLLKCLKSSPERIDVPQCSKGRVCDGCSLMQMRYPAQLNLKRALVEKHLRHYPSLGHIRVLDTIGSPEEFGYRNSAKLVVAGKSADPVIGMYKRNSHDVLENLDCPLHHPLINKVVKAAKAGIKKGKVPIYNPKSEMGLLRYLVVRVAQPGNRVMVALVTSEVGYNEMHHLAKYIQQEVPEVAVVAQNINSTTGNVIFGTRDRFLTKAQTLRTQLGETTFSLSPRSFFQVNSGAARIIYEKVRELAALQGTERVIDLYCGIGGISLLLAKDAEEVVGIELVESAVLDAAENAKLNRIDNCEFEAGDAARLLDEIGEGGADVIVLNPPRKGCEEKVLKSAAALKPQKMIYVSCSPETLARDLDLLSRLGYRTVQVQPVDMFPQTIHVEDVALLERI